jgi:hypothetical protein
MRTTWILLKFPVRPNPAAAIIGGLREPSPASFADLKSGRETACRLPNGFGGSKWV